ncbi:hypothetical protein [Sediminicola sp. 1XM1-17]|uniref:hypothetical protein n=1 Tax=Sediminicola sp. 1XM1-17 TaxID=3127702 RepID=UPI003078351C
MIALKPSIQKSVASNIGVVLTPGSDQEQLDSLQSVHEDLKIIPYKINQPMGKAIDSVGSVYILGGGLASFDFWQLEKVPAKIIKGFKPRGITKLKYAINGTVGEEVVVKGSYSEGKKGNRLVLSNPRGVGMDSIILSGLVQENFKLTMDPIVVGKFKYTLVEKDSLATIISSEPLPLDVRERKSLKILMINNFPTFETKYLKNYLAEKGHQVTIRTQLTTNRYKYEYFNTEQQPFYNFTTKQLEGYDLLFMDFESYVNLSKTDLSALHHNLKINGLGLFIQPSATYFALASGRSGFSFATDKTVKTSLPFFPKLSVDKFSYNFESAFGLEIIHEFDNQILTAYQRMVNGRFGTTVVQNTYQLLLNGHEEAYEQFWSDVVTVLAKRNFEPTEWSTSSGFVFMDEPFEFNIRTAIENPEVSNKEKLQIPLRQDVEMVNKWYGTTFPSTLGWQQLSLKNDSLSTYDYFVMDTTKWKSITARKTLEENQRHFDGTIESRAGSKIWVPINQFWFFFIFITGMGYLWLESKWSAK